MDWVLGPSPARLPKTKARTGWAQVRLRPTRAKMPLTWTALFRHMEPSMIHPTSPDPLSLLKKSIGGPYKYNSDNSRWIAWHSASISLSWWNLSSNKVGLTVQLIPMTETWLTPSQYWCHISDQSCFGHSAQSYGGAYSIWIETWRYISGFHGIHLERSVRRPLIGVSYWKELRGSHVTANPLPKTLNINRHETGFDFHARFTHHWIEIQTSRLETLLTIELKSKPVSLRPMGLG